MGLYLSPTSSLDCQQAALHMLLSPVMLPQLTIAANMPVGFPALHGRQTATTLIGMCTHMLANRHAYTLTYTSRHTDFLHLGAQQDDVSPVEIGEAARNAVADLIAAGIHATLASALVRWPSDLKGMQATGLVLAHLMTIPAGSLGRRAVCRCLDDVRCATSGSIRMQNTRDTLGPLFYISYVAIVGCRLRSLFEKVLNVVAALLPLQAESSGAQQRRAVRSQRGAAERPATAPAPQDWAIADALLAQSERRASHSSDIVPSIYSRACDWTRFLLQGCCLSGTALSRSWHHLCTVPSCSWLQPAPAHGTVILMIDS